MPETNAPQKQGPREGLTLAKVLRFLSLPFYPAGLRTYLAVERFEDVPIQRLIDDGIRGVLLDIDGTLGPHHAREFSDSVVRHVRQMEDSGLKVAIYTNAFEDRLQQFPGIEVVTQAPAKPDRRGFARAMTKHLHLNDPSHVCMIGDNYITDGGAVSAGMRFIHVRPIKGNENLIHSLTRKIGYLCARFYFQRQF